MAEKSCTENYLYPYLSACGKEVALAIRDEVPMAHICHLVLLHTSDKLFANETPTAKKQYGLIAELKKFNSMLAMRLSRNLLWSR
jgi:hypothetical protein